MNCQMLLLLLTVLPNQLVAGKADGAAADDNVLKAAVATMAKEVSLQCVFSVGEAESGIQRLIQHPEPILRWSNPTAGSVFGEVYVWTDNGRPAVVASLYRWFSPDWGRTLEVCSVSDNRISGRRNGTRFWAADKPGLAFQPISNVAPPAKTPAARLVQMRRLAGDFVANLADTRGNNAGVKRQLRLLSQPVFRYPAANDKSTYLDGALFAFVEGTDPEVLLLLEATKSLDDSGWQFGLARMNSDALVVTHRDAKVWSAPHLPNPMEQPREPYTLFSLERPLRDVGSVRAPRIEVKP